MLEPAGEALVLAATWLAPARRLGQRLRELRGKRTQADVAAAARISRVYLSELERGLRPRPRGTVLDRLAEALGAPFEELRTAAGGLDRARGTPAGSASAPPVDNGGASGTLDRPGQPAGSPGASAAGVHNAVPVPPGEAGRAVPSYPVYRSGTRGDPRRPEEAPMPSAVQRLSIEQEAIVGPNGFGVEVLTEHLHGWRLHSGDRAWVNPDRAVRNGGLVVAEVEDEEGQVGMGVYELAEDGSGRLLVRPSHEEPPETLPLRSSRILGPVVGVSSWRSPDEGRTRLRRTPTSRLGMVYLDGDDPPPPPPPPDDPPPGP